LLPKRGTAFEVKDQTGVTIEFKRNAGGRVAEAALNDNGTAIVLKKSRNASSKTPYGRAMGVIFHVRECAGRSYSR
jgi:hypothetical protein